MNTHIFIMILTTTAVSGGEVAVVASQEYYDHLYAGQVELCDGDLDDSLRSFEKAVRACGDKRADQLIERAGVITCDRLGRIPLAPVLSEVLAVEPLRYLVVANALRAVIKEIPPSEAQVRALLNVDFDGPQWRFSRELTVSIREQLLVAWKQGSTNDKLVGWPTVAIDAYERMKAWETATGMAASRHERLQLLASYGHYHLKDWPNAVNGHIRYVQSTPYSKARLRAYLNIGKSLVMLKDYRSAAEWFSHPDRFDFPDTKVPTQRYGKYVMKKLVRGTERANPSRRKDGPKEVPHCCGRRRESEWRPHLQ